MGRKRRRYWRFFTRQRRAQMKAIFEFDVEFEWLPPIGWPLTEEEVWL